MKKLLLLLVLLLTIGITGCSSGKNRDLERNLYYNMNEAEEVALSILQEIKVDMLVIGNKWYIDIDRTKYEEDIDRYVDLVTSIKAPRYLRSEVKEWKEDAMTFIPYLDEVAFPRKFDENDGDLYSFGYALDRGRFRIFDGFREFNWR